MVWPPPSTGGPCVRLPPSAHLQAVYESSLTLALFEQGLVFSWKDRATRPSLFSPECTLTLCVHTAFQIPGTRGSSQKPTAAVPFPRPSFQTFSCVLLQPALKPQVAVMLAFPVFTLSLAWGFSMECQVGQAPPGPHGYHVTELGVREGSSPC